MPTPEQIQQAIGNVSNQETFIGRLLRGTLNWPINLDFEDIEDITFEWTADELNATGLDESVLTGPVLQMQSLTPDGEQPWGIFILEFSSDAPFTTGRGLTGPLRKVLRGLVSKRRDRQANLPSWDRENLLFICTHDYRYFRFAYFKKPEKDKPAPLTTFGWEPGSVPRTVCEYNLGRLVWPDDTADSQKWVTEWAHAFDVEAVTKKFYEDYEKIYNSLLNDVQGLTDKEQGSIFVQNLMNRLLFLRFVERKGWLYFDGEQNVPQDYLRLLYEAGPASGSSWYNSRLKPLFFEGMAVPDHGHDEILGHVPYLNGGLFTSNTLDEKVTDVPDAAFEPILGENGLFYRYNFTVEESTPLDIDVAVDPEMLGKVFEKLVTTRRQKGSYYTPRVVVSFMCKEALKGFLGNLSAKLVDEDSTEGLSLDDARELLNRLGVVRVVDPACGSGAYLLGMLQELFRITKSLDTRVEMRTPSDDYQRKLTIIQNNLYGVDIDEFAVGIARLRLWLSLAVDFDGDHPEPLPNLDFKIECGDALSAPDPSGGIKLGLHNELMRKYVALRQQYLNPPTDANKAELLAQIATIRSDIVGWLHTSGPVDGFDWQAEFIEVFADGGFDIVIANPPYGAKGEAKVPKNLRDLYFNQRSDDERGQARDPYGIFIARGLQLLRPSGNLSYIVSDTWRTIQSHRPIRKRLLDTTTALHVLDLPSWVFDATVNTCILTLEKTPPSQEHNIIAGDLRSLRSGDWQSLSDNLLAVSGRGPDIQTLSCARYTYQQNLISFCCGKVMG